MHIKADEIESRLLSIEESISRAALRVRRSFSEIKLVAVSKRQPASEMTVLQNALLGRGQTVIFGESYVQEYLAKKADLSGRYLVHLIGPLQSNKVKNAVANFDVIESVHSEVIATAINAEAGIVGKVQDIYLQINISNDPGKKGFAARDLLTFVSNKLFNYSNLNFQGLMTITKHYTNREDVRTDYRAMFELKREVCNLVGSLGLDLSDRLELSMGMSEDFEIAVEEGASVVRIGTALFGQR